MSHKVTFDAFVAIPNFGEIKAFSEYFDAEKYLQKIGGRLYRADLHTTEQIGRAAPARYSLFAYQDYEAGGGMSDWQHEANTVEEIEKWWAEWGSEPYNAERTSRIWVEDTAYIYDNVLGLVVQDWVKKHSMWEVRFDWKGQQ